MSSTTLIIWQNVPEDCKLYLVPDVKITPEQRALVSHANGKLLNCSEDTDGLDFLLAALSESVYEGQPYSESVGIWKGFAIEAEDVDGALITQICLTGFLL